jgi:hypothetical protein
MPAKPKKTWMKHFDDVSVRKTPPFEQFTFKHDHFTKTGSGQTWRESSTQNKRGVVSQVRKRCVELEVYLQELVRIPGACETTTRKNARSRPFLHCHSRDDHKNKRTQ